MSPQQLDGARGTHLDDIYSLGATLYDLLTGKPPFYSGNVDRQIHERSAPSLTERRKEFNLEPAFVPPVWEAAVAACLAKDPAQRPQSAAEFAERLQLSAPRGQTVVPAKRPKRGAFWVGLAALGLIALGGFYFAKSRPPITPAAPANAAATIPEKSIAVLPFENMSDDKENAFFADGIQDDVLNSLAKIKELKVISRSSVMTYRNTAGRNLREIGRQLGVAHILEGSVRRTPDRVLVNVDLIDTQNDRQIWAERYDRTLGDSLTLQGELATEIAAALHATLSPDEKARVEARPTENSEAYVLYLRGREYQNRPSSLLEDDETAVHLYRQALALDPNFALAHARLSATLAHIYAGFQPTVEIKNRARAAAEESLRLRPDLGEGYLARALCLYWTEMDYHGALRELESAGRLLPNDADVESIVAYINRRRGHWRDALAGIARALARDPRNASIARELMTTQHMVRNWPAAEEAGERAVALAPERPAVAIEKSYVPFWSKGDLRPLQAVLIAIPFRVDPEGEVTWARWDAALLQRDFDAAERAVNARTADTMLTAFGTPLPKSYLLGCIATARGEPARAQPYFEAARSGWEAEALAFPLDPSRHGQLGLLYAYLGRKEDALREGRRAIELRPESQDAYLSPTLSGMLAMIYARTGEPDQALALIEHLLTIPGPWVFEGSMTLSDLRLRWQWDPLRNDPRFRKILAEPEPKTIY
ncbi:MAG: hypothetical protein ABIU29_12635, partial [Chthoniobacterales bacterium]